ncbi:hypothetical protein [Lacticaseibacillus zhaodongensis]|uniref:hypothetical protein n=1 Tax=Lacticaseibacillus zhaodongensis TaxID=2668065 RepID=UPI0012D30EB6|nr:hypothetical protein [Lacticaseibacillus zhaodongensis]
MQLINTIYNLFFSSPNRRAATGAISSSALNLLAGLVSVIWGAFTHAPWLVLNGSYYLLLFFSRRYALRQYWASRQQNAASDRFLREYKAYHNTGAFLIAIGGSYIVLTLWLFFAVHHPEESISAAIIGGLIAVIKIGIELRGIFNYRGFSNPIMTTIKRLNLAAGLISFGLASRSILMLGHLLNTVGNTLILGIVLGGAIVAVGYSMFSKRQNAVPWVNEGDGDADYAEMG